MTLKCSWVQVHPEAEALVALGFSPEDIEAAATPITCDVLTSFVYRGTCLVVVDFDGGVVIDASAVKLSAD